MNTHDKNAVCELLLKGSHLSVIGLLISITDVAFMTHPLQHRWKLKQWTWKTSHRGKHGLYWKFKIAKWSWIICPWALHCTSRNSRVSWRLKEWEEWGMNVLNWENTAYPAACLNPRRAVWSVELLFMQTQTPRWTSPKPETPDPFHIHFIRCVL